MSGRSSRAERLVLAVALVFALIGCKGDKKGAGGASQGEPLRVAAAADLALAFKEVGAQFEQETGKRVDFSFGSTGLLAKQISEGAPYDVFAAANTSFVDDVVKSGACVNDSRALYAKGRIVLWSKDPQALPKDVGQLVDAKYAKIAIANPEHAPYGRAAQQALTKINAWPVVEKRMVYGENVQQTLMFARSGNADIAIVALSLAIISPGNYVPIDPSLHEPLEQELVICKGGGKTNEARSFVSFVGSEKGRAIMQRFGFML